MKTTKSPRRVLQYSYLIGQLVLPDYSHRYSRHDFTQPQLFACLVLKEFLQLDYRKLAGLLQDAGELNVVIGLDKVPHFTTFQKAARRLLANHRAKPTSTRRSVWHRCKAACRGEWRWPRSMAQAWRRVTPAATTSSDALTPGNTGSTRPIRGFRRQECCAILRRTSCWPWCPSAAPGQMARTSSAALTEALSRVHLAALAADAGYDGEHHHRFAREQHGVRSLIPPLIGRPSKKPPSGYWRRQMKSRLHLTRYTQRWQVETVNSMLKRLLGSALRARRYWSQCREILLRAITLNIMILRRRKDFYRARQN